MPSTALEEMKYFATAFNPKLKKINDSLRKVLETKKEPTQTQPGTATIAIYFSQWWAEVKARSWVT